MKCKKHTSCVLFFSANGLLNFFFALPLNLLFYLIYLISLLSLGCSICKSAASSIYIRDVKLEFIAKKNCIAGRSLVGKKPKRTTYY